MLKFAKQFVYIIDKQSEMHYNFIKLFYLYIDQRDKTLITGNQKFLLSRSTPYGAHGPEVTRILFRSTIKTDFPTWKQTVVRLPLSWHDADVSTIYTKLHDSTKGILHAVGTKL